MTPSLSAMRCSTPSPPYWHLANRCYTSEGAEVPFCRVRLPALQPLSPDFQSVQGDVWRREGPKLSGAVGWGAEGGNALKSGQHHGQNHCHLSSQLPRGSPELNSLA